MSIISAALGGARLVLSRVRGVIPAGQSRWLGFCPVHEEPPGGHRRSLGIATGRDCRVLLKCHGGCPTSAVVAALGLTMRDLFADRAPGGGGEPCPTRRSCIPPREIERAAIAARCNWEDLQYRDEVLDYLWRRRGIAAATALDWGVGVASVSRNAAGRTASATWSFPVLDADPPHPLAGLKLHRDPPRAGEGKGFWIPRGVAQGKLLFPLVEALCLAPGAEIVLAPGELKALAYLSASIPATSRTAGEGAAWPPGLARRFTGLRVVLDPDREESEVTGDFVRKAMAALEPFALTVEVCR